jgi:DNA-binding IscR family transcriptional regulator
VWERLSNSIDQVLHSVTLEDMLEDHMRLQAEKMEETQ